METRQRSPVGKQSTEETNGRATAEALAQELDKLLPIHPLPLYRGSSGLYVWRFRLPIPVPSTPVPGPTIPPLPGADPAPLPGAEAAALTPNLTRREELRLDVDGRYPQMVASGTSFIGLTSRVHWIANLVAAGTDQWTGTIWYKDGPAVFPYTQVSIRVTRGVLRPVNAQVRFTGGAPPRTMVYPYSSPYFHPIELEFDCAEGTPAVTQINTGDHPDRPAGLPAETLRLTDVFRRAGFKVTMSGGDNIVPLALAGDAQWSDLEMHDAMQAYWSRFAPKAQWSMWTFFAALHEAGPGLGGIMFDDIGPNQRQGTAIFEESFIKEPPAGDPNPDAWTRRMRFWTAVHEMGHTLNLAHSWQKELGTSWIPLVNEPTEFSFMNYPFRVPPGPTDVFFQNFEYRFSDGELLFMRHAPFRFVEQGNALWFDHHGLQGAEVEPGSAYRLQLRVNRAKPVFQFLEPAMLELKLTNMSSEPVLIPEHLLSMQDRMVVIIKKDGRPARQHLPYARYCFRESRTVLAAGDSVYESLFVGAGRNGWDLAEPGTYTVQVALRLEGEEVVSNPLRLRVAAPTGYAEEQLAQDFFSDEVGRVLNFDGSSLLEQANATLRLVVDKLPESRAAVHARVALGCALTAPRKRLQLAGEMQPATAIHAAGGTIMTTRPNEKEARGQLGTALMTERSVAAETLGHVDYKDYTLGFADWLASLGETKDAASVANDLAQTLAARQVRQRVIDEVQREGETYRSMEPGKGRGRGSHAA
jgi:hypothetical protein